MMTLSKSRFRDGARIARHAFCQLASLALAVGVAAAAVPPDHFRSYPITTVTTLDGPIVQIEDQFGSLSTDLGRAIRFMVPVDKNDEGLFDPFSHSTCYEILENETPPPVISTNQFGAQPLTLGDPESLCVPTEKLITPGTVFLDHFKCYQATGASVDAGVSLIDQFGANSALVLSPRLFCTPANKNGEGVFDPVTHLTCYETDPPGPAPGLIPIQNQFSITGGDEVELITADLLCVPSTKSFPPPLDHFTVYDATGPDAPPVVIDDQFGSQTTDLGDVKLFMVPANKNDEGIVDPIGHLTCHEIVDGDAAPPGITVTNQFVEDEPLNVRLPTELCVPTEKLITPGEVDLDHFKCYEATGNALDLGIGLVDQFQGFSSLVADPFRLCNPASKNGEGVGDPNEHLVCYNLSPQGGTLGAAVPISNQFFSSASIDLGTAFAVCVPSVKKVPEPSFLLGLGSGVLMLGFLDRRRSRRSAGAKGRVD